jgi:hypothetical protein
MIIKIEGGKVIVAHGIHVEVQNMDKEMQRIWELLSTTIMWFIWIARCSKIFDNK